MWKEITKGSVYTINLKQLISDTSKEFIFEIEVPAIEHNLQDYNRNA
jgi:hypothetical protein